jgi:dienelactone hydrolase
MALLPTLPRTLRFARQWLGVGRGVREEETGVGRQDLPARMLRLAPRGSGPGDPRLPVWILLHGITRPGIRHPVFLRFSRALAASGAVVYLPEVPEWVALDLAPAATTPTVRAVLDGLAADPVADPARVGLMGFSFGAPQALVTAGAPGVQGRLATVAGFGAYCDLEATVRFLFTGEFDDGGRTRRSRPDPYGRWIVAANYLTRVPGFEDADAVAAALRELARVAGDARVPSWDARFDADKARVRAGLPPGARPLFDRFAPPAARDPLPVDGETEEWARRLAEAARASEPRVEPLRWIDRLPPSVHLLHGRDDVLIPYAQTHRLAEALRARSTVGDPGERRPTTLHTEITGLFAHSAESGGPGGIAGAREGLRFARALGRVLAAL